MEPERDPVAVSVTETRLYTQTRWKAEETEAAGIRDISLETL